MSKKASKKPRVHRHFYKLEAYHDDDSAVWSAALTWTMDGKDMVTITTADALIYDAIKTAFEAMRRAQTDLRHEQLILPDMGDFQVFYHPAWNEPID